MRRTIFLTIFVGIVLFAADTAAAQCTCLARYVNITATGEYALADAVFVGTVTDIKKTARDPKTYQYTEFVRFDIERSWKIDLGAEIMLSNLVDGCINGFRKNERWLVYAYRRPDGSWRAVCCCSRTAHFPQADADVSEFEKNGYRSFRPR